MKKWSWLLVAAMGSAFGQDFPQKVSYTNDAGSLRAIIGELAQKNQLPIAVSAKLADSEILSIRVVDVPATDLLKRIAKACDGIWSLSGNTWTLEADQSKREAQRLAKRAAALKSLKENLGAILAPPKPPAKSTDTKTKNGDEEEEMDYGSYYSDTDKMMATLISRLDLGILVDMPQGGRLVFSGSPTRMQRALSIPAALIAAVVTEHNEQFDAQESVKNEEVVVDSEMEKYAEMRKRFGGEERKLVKITEPPAKALLVLERGGMFGDSNITCELKIYNQQGITLGSTRTSLSTGPMAGRFSAPAETPGGPEVPDPEKTIKIDPKSTKLVRSEMAAELLKYTSKMNNIFMGGGDSKTEISPILMEGFLHPETRDPLGYLIGEMLTQTAADRKLNLVAVVSDELASIGFSGANMGTCDEVYRMAKLSQEWDMSEADGWWILAAKDPLETRKQRADRKSLGQFARDNVGTDSVRLDSLASFATKNSSPITTPLASFVLMMVAPSAMQYMYDERNWHFLQLYGSLEAAQKISLQNGQSLALGTLTGSAAKFAQQIIFGAEPKIELGAPKDDDSTTGIMGAMMLGFGGNGREQDYRQEPTELLPNGLTQGFLVMPTKADFAFKPSGGGYLSMFGSTGVMELAMYRLMRETMKGQSAELPLPDIKSVKVGSRKTMRITLQLAADAAIRTTLTDDSFEKDGKDIKMENLPADIKARVDQMTAELKKMNLPFMDPSMFQRQREVVPPR